MIDLKLEQAMETYFDGVEGNRPKCIHHDSFFGEDGCHSKAIVTTVFCGERWFACREHKQALNNQWEPELAEDADLPKWELISTECSWCDKDLNRSEVLSPSTSEEGDIICDGCYNQEYMEICIICERYFPKEEADYIVIEEGGGWRGQHLERGVYEIVDTPYYVDSIFEVRVIADAVEKIRDIGEEELYWVPSGFICEDCATKPHQDKANKDGE